MNSVIISAWTVIAVGSSLCVYPGLVPRLSWSKLCKFVASQNLSEYATPRSRTAKNPLRKLRKALTDCKIPKEPPGLRPKACPNSQEVLGIVLPIRPAVPKSSENENFRSKSTSVTMGHIWPKFVFWPKFGFKPEKTKFYFKRSLEKSFVLRSQISQMSGNSWIWTEQLSEVSGSSWLCSWTAKTPRCGLKTVRTFRSCRGCVAKLQNALENSTTCMQNLPKSARKSNNCTYEVRKPLP